MSNINPKDMDAVWEDFDRVRHNREAAFKSGSERDRYIRAGLIIPNNFQPTPVVKSKNGGWIFHF